jgi:hypothetical protein
LKKPAVAAPVQVVKIPKADAIAKLSKRGAAIKVQMEAIRTQLKAAVKPEKYVLHFRTDALKKKMHFCKSQISRLKKEPGTEVVWDDRFDA